MEHCTNEDMMLVSAKPAVKKLAKFEPVGSRCSTLNKIQPTHYKSFKL